MSHGTARALLLLGIGFAGGAVISLARADKTAPSVCGQWQMSLASSTEAPQLPRPPEYGAPITLAAPAGWEPFAVGPNGVIYYRRCAP
jgi:hypothetical protein